MVHAALGCVCILSRLNGNLLSTLSPFASLLPRPLSFVIIVEVPNVCLEVGGSLWTKSMSWELNTHVN